MKGFRIALLLSVVFWAAPVWAGTLETVGGKSYTGVVTGFDGDTVLFLWQKAKDQPEAIKTGDSDKLFQAQGQAVEQMTFGLLDIGAINGISADAFRTLYENNVFYRTVQIAEKNRIQVSSNGDFVSQIKAVIVLILAVGLIAPVLMILVSRLIPGNQVSFFGGLGIAVVFTIAGIAAATGSAILTQNVAALASSTGQYVLSGALILAIAGMTHLASSHSFFQGLGFSAVWIAVMLFAGKIASTLVGAGVVDSAIH